jgi:hypothetical protein
MHGKGARRVIPLFSGLFQKEKIAKLSEPFADFGSIFLCLDRVGASCRIILITFVSVASGKMLFSTTNPIASCTFVR